MFEADLLTTPPMLGETKSRGDLSKVLAQLRAERGWSKKGLPRADILEMVDDDFIHHREHADRMMKGGKGYPAAKGLMGVKMFANLEECDIVVDGSREWTNKPHRYVARIHFCNYGLIRESEKLTWMERARLLMGDNLMVDCDCNAYRYFYRYGATKRGFALVAEKRRAKVKNPGNAGTVCKHLEHALKYLGANYAVIASAMKRHHQNLEEHMSEKPVVSEALVCGHLHEDVQQFGVTDTINGLMAECSKRGMARTASALRMALTMAATEGAPAPSKPALPDTRTVPVVQDKV